MPLGTVGRFFDRIFKTRARFFKKLSCGAGIALRERDASLEETFRCRARIQIRKFVQRRAFDHAFRRGVIALNHRDVPMTGYDLTCRIGSGRNFREKRFQPMGVAFPPKIDITALDFSNLRRGRHRTKALSCARSIRPSSQRGVRENNVADNVWISRIDLAGALECIPRFLPLALTALDRGEQSADLAVVRRQLRRFIKFSERTLVVAADPVFALTESKMT